MDGICFLGVHHIGSFFSFLFSLLWEAHSGRTHLVLSFPVPSLPLTTYHGHVCVMVVKDGIVEHMVLRLMYFNIYSLFCSDYGTGQVHQTFVSDGGNCMNHIHIYPSYSLSLRNSSLGPPVVPVVRSGSMCIGLALRVTSPIKQVPYLSQKDCMLATHPAWVYHILSFFGSLWGRGWGRKALFCYHTPPRYYRDYTCFVPFT